MMSFRRPISALAVLFAALAATGCAGRPEPASQQMLSLHVVPDVRLTVLEERKDEVIRQLSHCESGGWGPSDRKIYGGRGAYHGRLQFTIRTVQAYVRMRDGLQLSARDASELAHDYDRAADLAKYMIFDLEEPWHWPVCSRKIGMVAELRAIKTSYEALNR
ncbi:MAG: hypothetical protein KIT25_18085 [Enhydrobacter sp.]|nr:MAG: hypothetical protein KIT25_18085 [Enhydrobacter sp.]